MTTNIKSEISVVAICKNEEADLVGFLQNVAHWASEVILVDDNSTDKTREIAQQWSGVTVLKKEMSLEGGFAEQRNSGIAIARSEWVLNMDVDERVTRRLFEEIVTSLETTRKNAFRYRRMNFFLNRPIKYGGWGSWNRPHLARRGAHHFVGRLHEECVVDGGSANIGQLRNEMWHLNDDSYDERIRKSAQYSRMEADRILLSGRTVTIWSVVFAPSAEFFKKYILRLGFLDGASGLIMALHSGTAKFRGLALAWSDQNCGDRKALEACLQAEMDKVGKHHLNG